MRVEDQRLITGAGSFTDDTHVDGAFWAAFARASHAHAVIAGIDKSPAMDVAGARLVLTACPRLLIAEPAVPRPPASWKA